MTKEDLLVLITDYRFNAEIDFIADEETENIIYAAADRNTSLKLRVRPDQDWHELKTFLYRVRVELSKENKTLENVTIVF